MHQRSESPPSAGIFIALEPRLQRLPHELIPIEVGSRAEEIAGSCLDQYVLNVGSQDPAGCRTGNQPTFPKARTLVPTGNAKGCLAPEANSSFY